MDATIDLWRIPAESARRVGHPAPFPVGLPQRLIELYTFEGDLVLDPFLGSGSTTVAAVRTGRRYVGYDTDAGYVEMARQRVRQELEGEILDRFPPLFSTEVGDSVHPVQAENGKAARALAVDILEEAGFTIRHRKHPIPGVGLTMDLWPAMPAEQRGISTSLGRSPRQVEGSSAQRRSGNPLGGWRAVGAGNLAGGPHLVLSAAPRPQWGPCPVGHWPGRDSRCHRHAGSNRSSATVPVRQGRPLPAAPSRLLDGIRSQILLPHHRRSTLTQSDRTGWPATCGARR